MAPTALKIVRGARHLLGAQYLLGRYACLGRDVCAELGWRAAVENTQKGRADCLLEYAQSPSARPRTAAVAQYFARRDIVPLVTEQELFSFRARPQPALILLDSFAELTDQKFVERQGGRFFCANFSDLQQTQAFDARYRCDGLLACEALPELYRRLFSHLRATFKSVPIVFLHFPTTLDTRGKFKERGGAILEAIAAAGAEIEGFFSIAVDDAIVDWPAGQLDRDFPYHFNKAVYVEMARQIRAIEVIRPVLKRCADSRSSDQA